MLTYRDINLQDQSLFEDRISRRGQGIQAQTKEIRSSLQKLVGYLQQFGLSQQDSYNFVNRYGYHKPVTHLSMALLGGAIYYTTRTNMTDASQLTQLDPEIFYSTIQTTLNILRRGLPDIRSTEEQELEVRILETSVGASLIRYIRYYLIFMRV